MRVCVRRKDDRQHFKNDQHALLRGNLPYHRAPFSISIVWWLRDGETRAVLRVPLNEDRLQCAPIFQTFGWASEWRWTSISRRGFEKKSRFETAIPSTIGERSRFIPRDSVASWDLGGALRLSESEEICQNPSVRENRVEDDTNRWTRVDGFCFIGYGRFWRMSFSKTAKRDI